MAAIAVDCQSESHVAAVRIAECINPFRIDRVLCLHSVDQRTDEAHIVDVLHLRWERRILPTVVPVVLMAVRVEHNEALLIGHLIEFGSPTLVVACWTSVLRDGICGFGLYTR